MPYNEVQGRRDSRDSNRSAFGGIDRAPRRDSSAGAGTRRGAGRRRASGDIADRTMADRSFQDRHIPNRGGYARFFSGDRFRGTDGRTAAAFEIRDGGGARAEARRRTERAR